MGDRREGKPPEERNVLHVFLSLAASEAISTLASESGVSMSGLMEALGQRWAVQLNDTDEPESIDPDLIRAARKIDAERRRRR